MPLLYAICALSLPLADRADQVPAAGIDPEMHMVLDADRIRVTGDVSSIAHEAILRQAVVNAFPRHDQAFDLDIGTALPPGWALVSEMTLRVLTAAARGSARLDVDGVTIRAVTTNAAAAEAAASRARKSLLPGMQLQAQIEEISDRFAFTEQCVDVFRKAAEDRHLGFARGSDSLGTASHPALDRLVQIAADCPDTRVTITGPADLSGAERANHSLGKARADAVADYFSNRGIASDRIEIRAAAASDRGAGQRIGIELTRP